MASLQMPSPLQRWSTRANVHERQESFKTRHGEQSAANFASQVAQVKAQLRQQGRFARFIIHPGKKNKFLATWDVITGLALVYTATLTPFEAGFLPAALSPINPWFLVNRGLDVIFLGDMLLHFFLAYQSIDHIGGLVWVLDQRKIAFHYLSTWCALDALTVFVPGIFDCYFVIVPSLSSPTHDLGDTGGGAAADGSSLVAGLRPSTVRALRVVRLAKLIRLVRASRLYKRWMTRITMSSSTQTVVQCALLLFLGAHWYACVIGMQTALHHSPSATWLGPDRYGYCRDGSELATPAEEGSIGDSPAAPPTGCLGATGVGGGALADSGSSCTAVLPNCEGMRLESYYLASLTWALMLITGTGCACGPGTCATHSQYMRR